MKRLILSLTIGALGAGYALADRPKVEEKTQQDNADYEHVMLTGSHLKQKERGIITVGSKSGNVITIDQREMERNGGGTIADQLRHYPGVSISGH